MSESLSSGATGPTVVDASSVANSTSSFWDRISTWAADNKATVYTIAGITLVVTGAGAVYYYSGSSAPSDGAAVEKKKAKKDKKKAKKDLEKGETDKKQPSESKCARTASLWHD